MTDGGEKTVILHKTSDLKDNNRDCRSTNTLSFDQQTILNIDVVTGILKINSKIQSDNI